MNRHGTMQAILPDLGELGCDPHTVFGIAVIGTVKLAYCGDEGDVRQCAAGAHAFLEGVQPRAQPDGGQGWPSKLDAQTCVADAASLDPGGASLAGSLEVKDGKHLGVTVVILDERYALSPNSSMLSESDSNTDSSFDVEADETDDYLSSIG